MLRCFHKKQKDHPVNVDASGFTENLKCNTPPCIADMKQSLQTPEPSRGEPLLTFC